jgi:Domain of unknown function (DUF4383)
LEVDTTMGMARTIAVVFGAVYLVAGLAGFILETPLFGLFEVNTLHNIVHVLLGAILLYAATSTPLAVMATRGVGGLLVVLAILGIPFPDGFGLVPLGGNDIWLHAASGAILLVAGFLAPSAEAAAA